MHGLVGPVRALRCTALCAQKAVHRRALTGQAQMLDNHLFQACLAGLGPGFYWGFVRALRCTALCPQAWKTRCRMLPRGSLGLGRVRAWFLLGFC